MGRYNDLFRQPAFHTLVFCLSILLFSWPFFAPDLMADSASLFTYFFMAWAFAIAVLFLISRSCRAIPKAAETNDVDAEE